MSPASPTPTVSFVARLVAKGETAAELTQLLTAAVQMANEEAGTLVWFALQTDPTTFWIVDAFANEADRRRHLEGPIAAALMANADRLLGAPVEIMPADVLAAKMAA
jgi:quinol monooxygenase YgiN